MHLNDKGASRAPAKVWDLVPGWVENREVGYNLELAVLALARIMCANIHSQNGTAILAQVLLITQVNKFESFSFYPLDLCYRHVWCTSEL